MAIRLFSSLVPRINPSVPGCPYATIVQHIRDAAIEVCERTLGWRYEPLGFLLTPGQREYVYEKPDDTEVHAVLTALVNCVPLHPMTLEQAVRAHPKLFCSSQIDLIWDQADIPFDGANLDWDNASINYVASKGTPWGITQISPDKFIVFPVPDNKRPYKIKMVLALKPTRTAPGMDEAAFNELEDAIVHGTLQRLLLLPKQKWEDRELASYHAKQYLARITERRARANLTNARATLRVQIPPF